MSQIWQVRLSAQAEQDLIDIPRWTAEHFGPHQAEQSVETILLAIDALHDGPRLFDAKPRNELGSDIDTLHIARQGRKGRHFLVYSNTNDRVLNVLRLLHDSVELARHISSSTDHPH